MYLVPILAFDILEIMIDLFIHLMQLLVLAEFFSSFITLDKLREWKTWNETCQDFLFPFLFCQEIWLNFFLNSNHQMYFDKI